MLPEDLPEAAVHRCPQCGADNPVDAHYCGNCGAQIRSQFDRPSGPVNLESSQVPVAPSAPFPAEPPIAPLQPPAPEAPNVQARLEDWQANVYQPSAPAQPAMPQAPLAPPPPVNTPGAGLSSQYAPPPHSLPGQPAGPAMVNQQVFHPGNYDQGMNTSGLGEGYPVPPEASGWTWAGFVPWGLFSFFTNNSMWGVIGLVSGMLGFQLIYSIIIGATGRQMAWKSKRYESIAEYEQQMKSWNTAGLAVFAITTVLVILIIIAYIILFAALLSAEMQ